MRSKEKEAEERDGKGRGRRGPEKNREGERAKTREIFSRENRE